MPPWKGGARWGGPVRDRIRDGLDSERRRHESCVALVMGRRWPGAGDGARRGRRQRAARPQPRAHRRRHLSGRRVAEPRRAPCVRPGQATLRGRGPREAGGDAHPSQAQHRRLRVVQGPGQERRRRRVEGAHDRSRVRARRGALSAWARSRPRDDCRGMGRHPCRLGAARPDERLCEDGGGGARAAGRARRRRRVRRAGRQAGQAPCDHGHGGHSRPHAPDAQPARRHARAWNVHLAAEDQGAPLRRLLDVGEGHARDGRHVRRRPRLPPEVANAHRAGTAAQGQDGQDGPVRVCRVAGDLRGPHRRRARGRGARRSARRGSSGHGRRRVFTVLAEPGELRGRRHQPHPGRSHRGAAAGALGQRRSGARARRAQDLATAGNRGEALRRRSFGAGGHGRRRRLARDDAPRALPRHGRVHHSLGRDAAPHVGADRRSRRAYARRRSPGRARSAAR